MAHARVPVVLGDRSYDVLIGDSLLGELPHFLEECCPAERYGVVTDTTVAALYGRRIASAIGRHAPSHLTPFPAGERHKTRSTWTDITDELLRAGLGRDGALLAVGGGVVGDVAGFVAATYLRGIPYVQVPTTLLAMIDSSVGGKTGVDTAHGKNLVGAFHQPRLVVADVDTLGTLPPHHLAAGLAEALKHAAIDDIGYFEELVANRERLVNQHPDQLTEAVRRSVEIKSRTVSADETEQGRRAALNFGHTVGHAIEATTDYAVVHGDAVAMGMVAEARLGQHLGVTEPGVTETLRDALAAFDLPTAAPPGLRGDLLLDAMEQDKKKRAGRLHLTLLKRVGEVARTNTGDWTFEVEKTVMRRFLDDRS